MEIETKGLIISLGAQRHLMLLLTVFRVRCTCMVLVLRTAARLSIPEINMKKSMREAASSSKAYSRNHSTTSSWILLDVDHSFCCLYNGSFAYRRRQREGGRGGEEGGI